MQIDIIYRDFYDIPRLFLTHYQQHWLLFDCPFDEQVDEYVETFRVYLMPELSESNLEGDWSSLPDQAERSLGEVPTQTVRFDSTRRRSIDSQVLDQLIIPLAMVAS